MLLSELETPSIADCGPIDISIRTTRYGEYVRFIDYVVYFNNYDVYCITQ